MRYRVFCKKSHCRRRLILYSTFEVNSTPTMIFVCTAPYLTFMFYSGRTAFEEFSVVSEISLFNFRFEFSPYKLKKREYLHGKSYQISTFTEGYGVKSYSGPASVLNILLSASLRSGSSCLLYKIGGLIKRRRRRPLRALTCIL